MSGWQDGHLVSSEHGGARLRPQQRRCSDTPGVQTHHGLKGMKETVGVKERKHADVGRL